MFAPDTCQNAGDMAILAIKLQPALRIAPAQA